MNKELTERDKFFYAVISALNDDEGRGYRGGLFYGGELGCCLIWLGNSGRWECKWYELEYPPASSVSLHTDKYEKVIL
jgi:hypothetical protein